MNALLNQKVCLCCVTTDLKKCRIYFREMRPPPPKTPAQLHKTVANLLERDDVLILDTETTGLKDAEVIEVSVINTRGEVLLDTLVRPRKATMNPHAQRVHGISLSELGNQPTWPEILPELSELTDRATVLAWNAPFDARMLEQTSAAWGLTHPKILFACAMQMYARLKQTKRTGLHKAVGQEGLAHLLEMHQSHRALGDVRFVLEVLRAITQRT